jgi:hypothetical protein
MRPIWYFVGLLLTVVGVIITAAGVYDLFVPPAHTTVLGELHPGIWWGAIILLAGIIYLISNRNKIVE